MPRQYTARVPLVCAQCGATFMRPPSSRAKFCSWECRWAAPCPRIGRPHGVARPLEARFWERVRKDAFCWETTGARHQFGYGSIVVRDAVGQFRSVGMHRVAWELVAGPVPDGLFVLHTCDNPACVRNDDEGFYEVNGVLRPRRGHLFLGTPADNSRDMAEKGRSVRGERSSQAKLCAADVLLIRARFAAGGETFAGLGREFGVSYVAIRQIVRGVNWRWVA